jgi:hypothetical protein
MRKKGATGCLVAKPYYLEPHAWGWEELSHTIKGNEEH